MGCIWPQLFLSREDSESEMKSVVKNLVAGIVDYAGLFPPASLPLDHTVQNFSRYLSSDYSWMLSRLILPVARLEEIELIDSFVVSEMNWQISALVPAISAPNDAFAKAIESITHFNQRHNANHPPRAIVDSVEIKASTVDDVLASIGATPSDLKLFIEISTADDPTRLLEQIRQSSKNAFAKIRTGGISLDLIPSELEVARFIYSCAKLNVGFKATAGLHHPMQGLYPLTYAADPEYGKLFGYLNIFIAACFAFSKGISTEVIQAILIEPDSTEFRVADQSLAWRDLEISADQVYEIRTTKAISFGSCSFEEPTTELAELDWLEGVGSANDNY